MRRRDREVTDMNEIMHILEEGKVLHLGLSDKGMPYIVPMNYGFQMEDGKLTFYLHGALEGRKLDVIKENPLCCAQIDCDGALVEGKVACQYGYSYYSLMGFGKATIVDDPSEKMKGLTLLMKEQTGRDFEFNEKLVSIVAVIRVDCDSFTAKHRPLSMKPQV